MRKRVAGVDHEVDDELLDLRSGDPDVAHVAGPHGQRDVLADQAAEHRLDLAHGLAEGEGLGRPDVPPSEGQQLAGQRARPRRTLRDRGDRFAVDRQAGVEILEAERREAADRGQDVVDVVRNAAGQLPHGLEAGLAVDLGLQGPHGSHSSTTPTIPTTVPAASWSGPNEPRVSGSGHGCGHGIGVPRSESGAIRAPR